MNELLKKAGAWGILITIISGLVAEARSQIAENHRKIIKFEERQRSQKEILIEVKNDVKFIKQQLMNRR